MALLYTNVQGFWKFLGINKNILSVVGGGDGSVGQTPSRETVASATVSAGNYYLDQPAVNEDQLTLYVGTGETALTETTDYTFDSDLSKVTITASGAVALSGQSLTAVYEYSGLGDGLNYNETTVVLEQSEDTVNSDTNVVFAEQSDTDPGYLKVSNELHKGEGGANNLYQADHSPIIKLQTTVDGNYTTGATTIDVVDASGFPNAGTIYIGGNKVSYTSKSSNTLTIPSSTPSISDEAVVRGEVVEVSTSPSGASPTFSVLTPDSDYAIDYDTGEIQLLDDYYGAEDTWLDQPQNGVFDRVRLTYFHAWHEPGKDAVIPDEIKQVTYMIAGRHLVQRTVLKSLAGQRDNFNPQSFAFSKTDIDEKMRKYRMIHARNV